MMGAVSSPGRQRGQSVVEFALMAGVFLLILMGLFDVGRAVWYFGTMENAVREGTRYAIVHGSLSSNPVGPSDASTVTATVDRYAGPAVSPSKLNVTTAWLDGNNNAGSRVRVSASYPFQPFLSLGLARFTISATSTRNIVH